MPWGSWSLGPGRPGLAAQLWAVDEGERQCGGVAVPWDRGAYLPGGAVEGSWTPPHIPAWLLGWAVRPPSWQGFLLLGLTSQWLANYYSFGFNLHKWNNSHQITWHQDSLCYHRESDEQILLLLLDAAPSVAHTLPFLLHFGNFMWKSKRRCCVFSPSESLWHILMKLDQNTLSCLFFLRRRFYPLALHWSQSVKAQFHKCMKITQADRPTWVPETPSFFFFFNLLGFFTSIQ